MFQTLTTQTFDQLKVKAVTYSKEGQLNLLSLVYLHPKSQTVRKSKWSSIVFKIHILLKIKAYKAIKKTTTM